MPRVGSGAIMDRMPLIMMRIMLAIALLVTTGLATMKGGPVEAAHMNDKFCHLAGFFMLAWLADFSFPRAGFGLTKILPLLGYGLLIEIIQFFLPYRSFSLLDLVADGAGIALYGMALLLLGRHSVAYLRRALVRD